MLMSRPIVLFSGITPKYQAVDFGQKIIIVLRPTDAVGILETQIPKREPLFTFKQSPE